MEGWILFFVVGLSFCGASPVDSGEKTELCPGPHEYFSCGGACDNVCATLYEQSQQNCPIRNIRCNEMCYCEEGYARDAGGVCVPIQQCTS